MKKIVDESGVDKNAVLKFESTWCAPCKMLNNHLTKMENEFPEYDYFSVDIYDAPKLAAKYMIRSVPTVVILKEGKEQKRVVGAVKIEPLRKVFRDLK